MGEEIRVVVARIFSMLLILEEITSRRDSADSASIFTITS